ncbi:MAG: hypothetical protein Q7T55_23650 [Solirubrobacteraceae bacterium]|nr:hypothetical protein [Solirubrobacteraceae bacterium]
MSDHELRTSPFDGHRTIVAGGRSSRPGGIVEVAPAPPVDPQRDPFLEGHEAQTPPELAADRPGGGPADGPGWVTRVVPNAFPLLVPDAPPAEPEAVPALFLSSPATGHHEVIVQAPTATGSLGALPLAQLERVVAMWQSRLRAHAGAPARHLIVNERAEAGASQPHTHAQLVVLPSVPAAMARERERAEAYTLQTMGGNLTADYLQEEVRRGHRVVAVDDDCVLIAPWASRGAYHLTILPRRAALRFEDEPESIGAAMLFDALRRLTARFGATPPFNLWVRTAVSGAERTSWRIELLPVLAATGGVELGTGLDITTVAPEQAAEALRSL